MQDWLGKNFACHQLAQKASGKYLIFLDADVELSPDAIYQSGCLFSGKRIVTFIGFFPSKKWNRSPSEVTVPLMNWILQSLLPMILVQKTKFPVAIGG